MAATCLHHITRLFVRLKARNLLVLLAAFAHLNWVHAEELVIPVYDRHQPPLVLLDDGAISGIYVDLFREILTRAGIAPRFVSVPKRRARIMFEEGESVLSCCDNPVWRTRPKEQQVQMFSVAFYNTRDVFVFPVGKRFEIDNLSTLSDKRVAVIRGYGYRGSEWFGERVDIAIESELLEFIALGRADVAIVNDDVAKLWLFENGPKVELGSYHDIASLHVRVHRKREDLLPKINEAIGDIIRDGTRDRIVNRYLSGAGS